MTIRRTYSVTIEENRNDYSWTVRYRHGNENCQVEYGNEKTLDETMREVRIAIYNHQNSR